MPPCGVPRQRRTGAFCPLNGTCRNTRFRACYKKTETGFGNGGARCGQWRCPFFCSKPATATYFFDLQPPGPLTALFLYRAISKLPAINYVLRFLLLYTFFCVDE